MTNKEKRDLAESYFLHTGMSQQEIAARVGISENSLSKWKAEGDWEVKRGAKTATKAEIITASYLQISAIQRLAQEAGRLMNAQETQAISIISKVIERLDKKLSIDSYITIIEELTNHLFARSPDRAKLVIADLDDFIRAKYAQVK